MRYITIRRYDISIALLITIVLVASATVVATSYLWFSKTIPFSVQEPLTVTNYPATINTDPGENMTLNITITNSANVNYEVTLTLTLNDTSYQQSYVEFSNKTYNIIPGSNQIQAWLKVQKKAPSASLELTIAFHRE